MYSAKLLSSPTRPKQQQTCTKKAWIFKYVKGQNFSDANRSISERFHWKLFPDNFIFFQTIKPNGRIVFRRQDYCMDVLRNNTRAGTPYRDGRLKLKLREIVGISEQYNGNTLSACEIGASKGFGFRLKFLCVVLKWDSYNCVLTASGVEFGECCIWWINLSEDCGVNLMIKIKDSNFFKSFFTIYYSDSFIRCLNVEILQLICILWVRMWKSTPDPLFKRDTFRRLECKKNV